MKQPSRRRAPTQSAATHFPEPAYAARRFTFDDQCAAADEDLLLRDPPIPLGQLADLRHAGLVVTELARQD